ncbi:MAG: PAS domain S-box protein [Actinobacteria bacterium]|nr:PAS domain S-box protein [Actinomycetota bacterium]
MGEAARKRRPGSGDLERELSKEQLERIIEAVADGVVILNRDGIVVFVNAAAEQTYGLKRTAAIGRPYNDPAWKITTPDGRAFPEEELPFARVMGTGKPVYGAELSFERPDGTRIIISVNAAPLRDESGVTAGVVTTFTDITEHERAEEELRKSESKYKLLVENLPQKIFLKNRESIYLSCNEMFARDLKIIPDEISGKTDYDFFPKELADKYRADDSKIMRSGRTEELDEEYIQNGRPAFVHTVKTPIKDERGNVSGILGIFWDITELIRAKERVRAASLYARNLIEASLDPLVTISPDGKIMDVNKSTEEVTGFSRERLIGSDFSDYFTEPERAREGYKLVLSEGFVRDYPLAIRHTSGRVTDVLYNATIFKNEVGEVQGVFAAARDITELKRAEDELRKARDELERRVEERTAELARANEGLRSEITERKLAKELSDALNTINAAISSTLDFDAIMRRVVVESVKAIGCESSLIFLREDDYWIVRYLYGLPRELLGRRLSDNEAKISLAAARTRRPVAIHDVYADERINRNFVETYNIRSSLAVPLVVREDVIGTLFFHYHSTPVSFTEAQIDFAGKLGAAVSLGIENARILEIERRIAEILQESLMRPVPKIAGLDIGVAYKSAFEAERVGGDFYDIFELEAGLIAVLIGDVAGRGVEAAGLTETIRSSVRTLAYIDPSPSFIFSKTNQSLLRQIPPGQFATAALLMLDGLTGEIRYASAGHPPAAVCCGGEYNFLSAPRGLPLGAFPGIYKESYLGLRAGESIILYTDGLTEARRGLEFFGDDRLIRVMYSVEPTGSQALVDGLLQAATELAEGKLKDDIAIVAIRIATEMEAA